MSPPCSIEAETALLGCILRDNTVLDGVLPRVSAEDFYELRHGIVYKAMCAMRDRGNPIGAIGLREHLGEELNTVGGVAFLSQCEDATPSSLNWSFYADIIQSKARLRRVLKTSQTMEQLVRQGGDDADILEVVEQQLMGLFRQDDTGDEMSLKQATMAAVSLMEKAHESEGCVGVPTGFAALDRLTTGMRDGNMIVLAARPSMGKTSLAMNIALNAAINEKIPVGVFSIEMTGAELGVRALAEYARTDGRKMLAGELSNDDIRRVTSALPKLANAPLIVEEVSGLTPSLLRAKARRMMAKHKVRLIVIDYLQLMSARAEGRVAEVTKISNAIKALAKELKVPVLALSQLNRNADGPEEPRLSTLRDSGSIEQDADMVWMLHRPDSETDLMKLLVLKNRNGPVAAVDLVFTRRHFSFRAMGLHNETNQ